MAQPPSSVDTIFHLLRELPETTRTDLVTRTGLSKATVSEIISLLLTAGVVTETGKRLPGRGGRPQVIVQLRACARLVIGAEIGEHGCRAVLADLRAGPIMFAKRSFVSRDADNFIDALVACVAELRARAQAPVLGIGIGAPGLVDHAGRRVAISVPFGWRDIPLAARIEERTGLPTIMANRAKAAALGEYWQRSSRDLPDYSHLAYVTVGAGIVAGFVVNGAPYYGHVGAAGELGHITVEPDGPLCGCGNHGCLHTLASESAIIRQVCEIHAVTPEHVRAAQPPLDLHDGITIDDLASELRNGHPTVVQAVERAAFYLGIGIGNVINLMNPSQVIIGGSVAAFGDVLLVPLRAEIQRRALWDARKRLSIAPSKLGDDVGPIGGAALYLSRVSAARIIAQ